MNIKKSKKQNQVFSYKLKSKEQTTQQIFGVYWDDAFVTSVTDGSLESVGIPKDGKSWAPMMTDAEKPKVSWSQIHF